MMQSAEDSGVASNSRWLLTFKKNILFIFFLMAMWIRPLAIANSLGVHTYWIIYEQTHIDLNEMYNSSIQPNRQVTL